MERVPYKEEVNRLIFQINNLDRVYLNAVLHAVSDGLELISGLPKNRLYLSLPARYGSKGDDVLEPFHIRGYRQYPAKNVSLALRADPGGASFPFTRRPLQGTLEAKACKSLRPVIATDYSGPEAEGSAVIGKLLHIKSSMLLPIMYREKVLGLAAVDSAEPLGQEYLLPLKDPVAEFLNEIARKLSEVTGYWSSIVQEMRAEAAMGAYKISLLLEEQVFEGAADLALLMTPAEDPAGGMEVSVSPFSLACRSGADGEIFGETLEGRGGRMPLGSQDFLFTSELTEKRHGRARPKPEASNTPSLLVFRDRTCAFERELEKKAGFSAALFYPVVDSHRELLYAIILYLKKDALKRVRKALSEKEGIARVKGQMKALESKINSVLFGLSPATLVVDHLLKIYRVNRCYEEFNKLKDIRRGLTEFLHRVLYNIMVISGADCGTIGIIGNINGKKYLIVEREGGVVVGAKAGDIQNSYIRPLRVDTAGNLISNELSLPGVAAAEMRTRALLGVEGSEDAGLSGEPFPEMKSSIATPVILGQNPIAVIHLGARRRYFFTEKMQGVLEMIAEMVGENIYKLINKYEVSVEVLRLYGGRYPYIKNDALNYLAELYHNYYIDLSRFLDETLQNYRSRRRDRKDKENYITLKDIKKTHLDSNLEKINLEEYLEKADNDIANYIYLMLKNRKAAFQDAVQSAYARHDISRKVAVLIFEKAKLTLQKPQITKIAVHLNACSESYKGNYEEKKKIEKFRQFYKKTIGISI